MADSIGRLRLWYAELGSTNDLARALAAAGYPHGTTVVADYQTAGRGRQGRRWEAPPGAALLCSVLVRPAIAPAAAARLMMAAGLAAAEAIQAAGVPAGLKWPNDVLVPATPADAAEPLHWRKVAGVLVETVLVGAALAAAVVGIGINVSAHPADLGAATDLSQAAGRPIDRRAVLDLLLAGLDRRLARLDSGDDRAAFQEWRDRLLTLGRPVHVVIAGARFDGQAEAVEPDGALLVRDGAGRLHRLLAADVTLRHSNLNSEGGNC